MFNFGDTHRTNIITGGLVSTDLVKNYNSVNFSSILYFDIIKDLNILITEILYDVMKMSIGLNLKQALYLIFKSIFEWKYIFVHIYCYSAF